MGKANPARGVLFLYFSSFSEMGFSVIFWILVARMATSTEVGVASTLISISALILGLADLGIARGLPRFLGESYGSKNMEKFRQYLNSSFPILLISTSIAILFILLSNGLMQLSFGFSFSLVIALALIILFANLSPPFKVALVSLLRTDYHSVVNFGSGVAKIIVGVLLVSLGLGSLGIVLGLLAMYVVSLFMSVIATWRLIRIDGNHPSLKEQDRGREIELLKAGLPSYIPSAIQHLGVKIGILLVFGTTGAVETAFYYMALQIYGVAVVIPTTIMNLLFPYISGAKDRDDVLVDRGLRLSLLLTLPAVFVLVLYPFLPLSIIGVDYIAASEALRILLLSIPLIAIISGVNILAYARGRYLMVLAIGIFTNMPRLLLYFILVPHYFSIGASYAFLLGTFIGLFAAGVVAIRMNFSLNISMIIKISIPSIVITLFVAILRLHWIIGSILIVFASFFSVMRLNLLPRDEFITIWQMIIPSSIIRNHRTVFQTLLRIMYGR